MIGLLGTGAFAAVYRAIDPALEAEVAIKVLADHHSAVADIRQRFINEARVLRRLASERIVGVHDIGEEVGQPYVVMELIGGGTLEDRLAEAQPGPSEIARLVSELAACLAAAHDGGIVHRDIKPSNLLLRPARSSPSSPDSVDGGEGLIRSDERLVLADFGLARALGLTSLTVAGGTDGYIAPEQRMPNTTVDERADVFAASAVVASAVHGSISDEVQRELSAGSDPLDAALAVGLAADPDDRPSSAAEWETGLLDAIEMQYGDVARSPVGATRSRHETQPAPMLRDQRSRSLGVALAVVVAMVAAVVGGVVWANRDDTTEADGTALDVAQNPDRAVASSAADQNPSDTGDVIVAGDWSTDDATIIDSDGDPVRIRGIDWGGFDTELAAPLGLWARNWRDVVDQIAELGFNTINLPFASDLLDDGTMPMNIDLALNDDLVDKSSLEVMDAVIGYAGTKGLAVTLERRALSPDTGVEALWYDDEHPRQRYVTDWELLSQRYGSLSNVVGATLAGAPHGPACWGCGNDAVDWKAAAELGGNVVHEFAPDWLIFVPGVESIEGGDCSDATGGGCAWWGADLGAAVDDPVVLEQADKVVYAPIEYATSTFDQPWFDDDDFPDNLPVVWERYWADLLEEAVAPVVVGFGSTLDSEVDEAWMETLLEFLHDAGASFVYRSLSPLDTDTGGLLNDDWITADDAVMSRLESNLDGPFVG